MKKNELKTIDSNKHDHYTMFWEENLAQALERQKQVASARKRFLINTKVSQAPHIDLVGNDGIAR